MITHLCLVKVMILQIYHSNVILFHLNNQSIKNMKIQFIILPTLYGALFQFKLSLNFYLFSCISSSFYQNSKSEEAEHE